eukprot:Rhum_TRINITY_DN15382_c0_g1::Rhum_TRINITY_DN15382_c0_g1_i2::g.154467::m.154467/K15920/XYL4; beta-D-xylosidase 4
MRSFLAVCAASCVAAQTVPATNKAYLERACRPGYDHFKFCDTKLSKAERVSALIAELNDDEIPPLLTAREGGGGSPGPPGNVSRLGLPAYDWGLNCLHGVQSSCISKDGVTYCPTSFPNPVNLGASFNKSMWEAVGNVLGREIRALFLAGATETNKGSGRPHIGLDCWSPNINLNHDPRWGRNQEVPSEDPVINGLYGTYVTKRMQNSPDESRFLQGVNTLKHWNAYSLEDSEGFTRYDFDAQVNNLTFADSWLPAWKESVVVGKAMGVMCSYNAVNGAPTCASQFYRDLLRDTWNYTGYVSSDTGALNFIYSHHHYVKTSEEAACVSIKAQTDVDSGGVYHASLLKGVAAGLCTMDDVHKALGHTFSLLFDMGLFDPVEDQPLWKIPVTEVGKAASVAESRQAAEESMVLLKNDGALPLHKAKRVAVLGPHFNASGGIVGNYLGQLCPSNTFDCIETPFQAIKRVNGGGQVFGAAGCSVKGTSTAGFEKALALIDSADHVVLAMGIDESVEAESHDRKTISLPGVQSQFIQQALKKAADQKKTAVLVLINGGMVALGKDIIAAAPAIFDAFYPGQYGSNAIATTLFGDNTRLGGKMPYTVYPADYINTINMTNMAFNDAATPGRSYKYYTGEVEFPFGFGLAYTKFEVSAVSAGLSLTCADHTKAATAQVRVKNTGSVTGDNVVIFYAEGNTVAGGLPLQRKVIGFERVHLAPGASEDVTVTVTADNFLDVHTSGDHFCRPGAFKVVAADGVNAAVEVDVQVAGESTRFFAFPDVPPRK